MSAQFNAPQPEAELRAMTETDLHAVMSIERRAYEFPWSRGNFADSLNPRYVVQVLARPDGVVLGYFVAMPGVEEMHLLNLTVDPALHGLGLGRHLLDAVLVAAAMQGALLLWLEVRPSNHRAIRLYERYGFHAVAKRRNYYPALDVYGQPCKEDALVMSAQVDVLRRRRDLA
ncbi:Ribosomal-protein-alanine acetyltransferase [Thiomonas sp. X19]|uniref:ribosomal protein S18-alanine N-acetyltransferase n=1 Tax=Thiomonas sp. X19 TaxID=1050370 RepID=UPI000B62D868|nr:ribosomal protein S18-alanine N-acetyltransferase [Thiomonas sp. X19]SCC95651.1 Ribosomal-protein-alanine acetyltransferase [Thiomonas sp. X19]